MRLHEACCGRAQSNQATDDNGEELPRPATPPLYVTRTPHTRCVVPTSSSPGITGDLRNSLPGSSKHLLSSMCAAATESWEPPGRRTWLYCWDAKLGVDLAACAHHRLPSWHALPP